MKKAIILVAGIALAASATAARADDVTFYLENVTFLSTPGSAPDGTATGTVVINTTTGTWVSGDITYLNSPTSILFDGAPSVSAVFDGFDYAEFTNGSHVLSIGVDTSTLVGYSGGPICTEVGPCVFDQANVFGGLAVNGVYTAYEDTGSLAPSPEPSSLMLMGTGLLGFAGVVRRRIAHQ